MEKKIQLPCKESLVLVFAWIPLVYFYSLYIEQFLLTLPAFLPQNWKLFAKIK